MAVDIRPARETDIDSIRTVASKAWHAGHGPIVGTRTVEEFLDEYYDADSFRSRIDDGAVLLSVAEDPDAGVVGFVMATPGDDDADYDLSQLYVLPDCWGRGSGRSYWTGSNDGSRLTAASGSGSESWPKTNGRYGSTNRRDTSTRTSSTTTSSTPRPTCT